MFSKQRNKNESKLQHNIHVGPQINANDFEDLTVHVKNKYKYACCDCSKENSFSGILSGTFGFLLGLCHMLPEEVAGGLPCWS